MHFIFKTFFTSKLLLSVLLTGYAATGIASESMDSVEPREVEVGVYITNLFNISLSDSEYETEFWAWFVSDDENYLAAERTEIVNAKEFEMRNVSVEKVSDIFWTSVVFKGIVKQSWDVRLYPFDRQTLTIALEDTIDPNSDHRFVADIDGSSIAPDTIPAGWTLEDFEISVVNSDYPTTFGDPSVAPGTNYDFDRVEASITLKRIGARLFATTFLGFFIATLLVFVVLTINFLPKAHATVPLQPRITLCVGALFSAVGGTYGLASKLPYTTQFTLADSLEITTFTAIGLAIIGSVMSDVLAAQDKKALAAKISGIILALVTITHIGINGTLLTVAAI